MKDTYMFTPIKDGPEQAVLVDGRMWDTPVSWWPFLDTFEGMQQGYIYGWSIPFNTENAYLVSKTNDPINDGDLIVVRLVGVLDSDTKCYEVIDDEATP